MTLMLVYCDDPPSHTANPLSLYITDPNPIVPKDVYIALTRDPGFGNSGNSTARLRGKRGDRNLLWARNEGQVREVRDAGTVLPPRRHAGRGPARDYRIHQSMRPEKSGPRGVGGAVSAAAAGRPTTATKSSASWRSGVSPGCRLPLWAAFLARVLLPPHVTRYHTGR